MPKCAAQTRRGTQCTRNILPGLTYCSIHNNTENPQRYFNGETVEDIQSNVKTRIVRGLNALNKIYNERQLNDLINANIIGNIISFLLDNDDIQINDAAAWVLTNISALEGTRGSELIWTHLPDMAERVHNFIVSKNPSVVSSLMMCLANIAASKEEYCDAMIDLNYYTTCVEYLKNTGYNATIRKNACFLLLNLVKNINLEHATFINEELQNIPPILLNDSMLLSDLLWVIHKLYNVTESLSINPSLLIENLRSKSIRLINPSLQTIGDIVANDNTELINRLLRCGMTRALHALLLRSLYVKQIIWIFSNLAVENLGSEYIVESPGLLLDIISQTPCIDLYFTLSNLAVRGNNNVINALIRCGCGNLLVRGLTHTGQIIRTICLEGIDALLKKGGHVVYVSLMNAGLRADFDRLGDEHNEQKALLEATLSNFQNIQLIQTFENNAPPYVINPSNAALLAAARVTLELSRGTGGDGRVSVSDLLFTADDVAYLNILGYVFQAGGTLGLPTRVHALTD
jgi:hypothetical protein